MKKIFLTLFVCCMTALTIQAQTTWTVAGDQALLGSNWDPSDANNLMTEQADGTFMLTKENVTLAANTEYKFKVCGDHSWDYQYGNNGGDAILSVKVAGVYDVTFTFDVNEKKLTAEATPLFEIEEPEDIWTIVGDENNGLGLDWNTYNETNRMTKDGDKYILTKTNLSLNTGDYKYQAVVNGQWGKAGGDQYLNIDAAGIYDITFTVDVSDPTNPTSDATATLVEATVPNCYVSGNEALTGHDWGTHDDMKMAYDSNTKTYSITIDDLTTGVEYKMQVVYDGAWLPFGKLASVPEGVTAAGNDIAFQLSTAGSVTVTFDPAQDKGISISGPFYVAATVNYYVTGNEAVTGAGKAWTKALQMTESDGKYSYTLNLSAGDHELKVIEDNIGGNQNWLGAEQLATLIDGLREKGDGNIFFQLDAPATITLTYDPAAEKGISIVVTSGSLVVPASFSLQPTTISFYPAENWKTDARFAAYFYDGVKSINKWVNLTDNNSDGIYEVANDQNYENVRFVRLSSTSIENAWSNCLDNKDNVAYVNIPNTANNCNTCWAPWKNDLNDLSGEWVAPIFLTDANWSTSLSAYQGQTLNLLLQRHFVDNDFHTICLPFDLPADWLGTAYQLSSLVSKSDSEVEVTTATTATIQAGKPYLLIPNKGTDYQYIILQNVAVPTTVTASDNKVTDGTTTVTMKPVFATGGTTNVTSEYWIGANGYLYNTQTNKLGLRAIFDITTKSGMPPRFRVVAGENATTDVQEIPTSNAKTVKMIENNQLIIIRNGVKYNLQGQIVK